MAFETPRSATWSWLTCGCVLHVIKTTFQNRFYHMLLLYARICRLLNMFLLVIGTVLMYIIILIFIIILSSIFKWLLSHFGQNFSPWKEANRMMFNTETWMYVRVMYMPCTDICVFTACICQNNPEAALHKIMGSELISIYNWKSDEVATPCVRPMDERIGTGGMQWFVETRGAARRWRQQRCRSC